MVDYVIPFEKLRNTDVGSVGGKNASLGEMISQLTQKEIRVPTGFATTAQAFQEFLKHNDLGIQIESELEHLDINDVQQLAASGKKIRNWIMQTPFPKELDHAIEQEYETLIQRSSNEMTFAVRSSATAEDLPDASFAGQQESFLNIHGIDNTKRAIKEVFASLYNDRAISYRVHKGFIHEDVSISAGVQQMVRSDIGCAGVMFSIDTESGFRDAVFITSSYGLGETVVQGAVNPDEFYLYKPALVSGHDPVLRRNRGSKAIEMVYSNRPGGGVETRNVEDARRLRFSITDEQATELARQALTIENHYGKPMDIEWALDGESGKLYIVQARPETVKSRGGHVVERYRLKETGDVIC